jgi:hypothetical protein
MPAATISYAGTPFCTSLVAPQAVTLTGTAGGAYSSTAGLTIDAVTGAITPSTSTAGTYTVTYTIAAAGGCSAVTSSTSVTINPVLPVSVTIAPDINPICTGSLVTFTATPVNEGLTPTYQWYNGAAAVGTNSPTFAYIPTNGDVITVVLTSSLTCASGSPATSAAVTMTVNPVLPASVTIAPDVNPICAGSTVTFTATPVNEGLTPTYQWYNGAAAVGINSPTFAYIPTNGDVITVVLTSSLTCSSGSPVTSGAVTMTVNPVLPVSVTIAPDVNPICAGATVNFTATPTNGGAAPVYQ